MDAIQAKAMSDPGYAIAWALCRLVEQQRRTADALGFDGDSPRHGTTESLALAMQRIAASLDRCADPPRDE